jgi:hypothetical protein
MYLPVQGHLVVQLAKFDAGGALFWPLVLEFAVFSSTTAPELEWHNI